MAKKSEQLRLKSSSFSDELRIWIISAIEDLQNINTNINNNVSPFQRTPNIIRVTNSGVINNIVYSFSVYNSGANDALILGQVIKSGEVFNFSAGSINNFYASGSITYDATGTELVIIYNT